MSRADYSWGVTTLHYAGEPVHVIAIVDKNLGGMSVTNDVEVVLQEIDASLQTSIKDHPIIYRDSGGAWDEIVIGEDGLFLAFSILPREGELRALMAEAVTRWTMRRHQANERRPI